MSQIQDQALRALPAQQRRLRPQQPWLSVDWEGWDFPEEGVLGRTVQARAAGPVSYSLRPAEGAATFARVLALTALPQVKKKVPPTLSVFGGDLTSKPDSRAR